MSSESNKTQTEACGPVDEVTRSCRVPVLFLFGFGLFWLVWASVAGFLAIMKFHMPGLLADYSLFTYGRVEAAAQSALVYGFAAQVAIGIMLWLICRMGRAKLAQPGLVITAILFWNLGVKFGLGSVALGHNTGYPWLELPGYAYNIMFFTYAVIAICALITFNRRERFELEISQWFLFAALFWFPWLLTGAGVLVSSEALRGVMQALVNWWYINNLLYLWLGLVGLAALFYYVPQFTEKPIANRSLARFSFWVFLFFGALGGVPHGAPVSMGIPSISTAATIVTVTATIGWIMLFRDNLAGQWGKLANDPAFRFFGFGLTAFLLLWIARPLAALYSVSEVTHFTFFTDAMNRLALYGFFTMTVFGVITLSLPVMCGLEWPSRKLTRSAFWTAAVGVVIYVLSMGFGGIVQGLALKNPDAAFLETARTALIYLRIATLGELFILTANVLIACHCLWLVCRCCAAAWRECCGSEKKVEPAEVPA